MKPDTYVALLRGINVGGKNLLPMKALASIFHDSGCGGVRTYIQSGNVLFEAKLDLAQRIAELIRKRIAEEFGFDVPVVTRSTAEIRRVVRANPFLKRGADTRMLHVAFLKDRPARRCVETLEPDRSPPDEFVLLGREIYLSFPHGTARSRLTTQYFDSRLETTSTLRNWNTVLKLLEQAGG